MILTVLSACALQAMVLMLIMAVAWLVQRRTGNSGWIDVGWTLAVGSVGVASALVPLPGMAPLPARQAAVALLLALWSLRLAAHLAQRSLRHGDDPRYAALIAPWGPAAAWRLLSFAQGQALAGMPLVATVSLAAHRSGPAIGAQDLLGLSLWAVSIALSALADRQMRRFASNPANRGQVCQQGLWAWSRHPNYFFEWLGWAGVALIAIDVTSGPSISLLALAAPVWMYWLLVHVSGIPPLEEHLLRTRAALFRDYQKRVSPFFPWPPASNSLR